MVFMQKQIEKNLNGTWDPPSWKIPSKISILFFGLPPIYHELFYFMMVLITGTYLLCSAFPWTKLGFLCTIFLSFLLRWTRLAAYFPISSSQQDPHSKQDALHKLTGKSRMNVSSVCPVCPLWLVCPVFLGCPVCPDDSIEGWKIKKKYWKTNFYHISYFKAPPEDPLCITFWQTKFLRQDIEVWSFYR